MRSAMSKQKDSEDLVRIGPGTVMGDMMRQYWLPAAMSVGTGRATAPRCGSCCWASG